MREASGERGMRSRLGVGGVREARTCSQREDLSRGTAFGCFAVRDRARSAANLKQRRSRPRVEANVSKHRVSRILTWPSSLFLVPSTFCQDAHLRTTATLPRFSPTANSKSPDCAPRYRFACKRHGRLRAARRTCPIRSSYQTKPRMPRRGHGRGRPILRTLAGEVLARARSLPVWPHCVSPLPVCRSMVLGLFQPSHGATSRRPSEGPRLLDTEQRAGNAKRKMQSGHASNGQA
ncbi:hypothetical protein FKP32DRAFT_1050650 [Trametes sanguinea]|nr:hypothetical protein FKP32DRAFT_1050650 [Trametes sanguinea]